jgi:hypothetical protein
MTKEEQDILRIEQLKHDEMLKSISVVISNPHGKKFIKYLFNEFSVGGFPPVGLYGEQLTEFMAYLRAGNSIYKIILESAPEQTGQLISDMEKERQDVYKKTLIDESDDDGE